MTTVNYSGSSPYADTPQTNWYLDLLTYRPIGRDGTDTIQILTQKYQNRPDLLSYDLYGTPNYWWVFMIVNPNQIKDPIYDMVVGLTIYCPTFSRLTQVLNA